MKYWKEILLYGLSLGVMLAFFQFSHYSLIIQSDSREAYITLIALAFTVIGIWAGIQWSRNDQKVISEPNSGGIKTREELAGQYGLTARELEVLALMAEGLSNQEIANRLFLSLNTIKTHSSNLFSKLDVQRRTQAIQKAKELGLLVG